MIISLSGTPGVGKTTAAKELEKIIDVNVISLTSLLKDGKIKFSNDKKRHTKIVDINDISRVTKKHIESGKINIIDGHLSYLLDSDIIIILRCRPDILEKRMKKKGWNESKIKENMEAEILDAITIEAIEKYGKKKIIEIDTTKKNPKQIAIAIKKILNNHPLQRKYVPGRIDWTKRYAKYLIR